MSVMNKELQIIKLKEFVKKKGLDTDTTDYEAEVDSTLTFFENTSFLSLLLSDICLKFSGQIYGTFFSYRTITFIIFFKTFFFFQYKKISIQDKLKKPKFIQFIEDNSMLKNAIH